MRKKQHSSSVDMQGFTIGMACMDTLPVIFFCIDMIILSSRFHSLLFFTGALAVILAGFLKVLWKFILAVNHKNIVFLNRQMRYLMPAGFIFIILSLMIDRTWSLNNVIHHLSSFPAVLFLIISIAGILTMICCARHLNGSEARSNWIEQSVNVITQFFIMLCIL